MRTLQPAWAIGKDVSGATDARDAMRLAGMDWTVSLEPVRASNGSGGTFAVEGHNVVVRDDRAMSDPSRIIGVVGDRYTTIQNTDSMGIADALADSGVRFDRAGTIGNGQRVFLTARMPEDSDIRGDRVGSYLILTTTHDGTGAFDAMFAPLRLGCSNQLGYAKRTATSRVTIRHTDSAGDRLVEAQRILQGAGQYFAESVERLNRYARTDVDRTFVEAYLHALIPDPKGDTSKARAQKARYSIARLFTRDQVGADSPALRGTAYGLINAVTEYTDHHKTVRAGKRSAGEARLTSAVWGAGATFRNKAFDLLERATVGADGAVSLVQVAHERAADSLLGNVDTTGRVPVDSILDGLDLN